jgi:hypothetical protein
MTRITVGLTAAWVFLAPWAGPAFAQQLELGVGEQRPWALGVSQENQITARTLFLEGNALLKNSLFVKAVEKYREALKVWDHPAIHYNMALALLNLNEPIALHEHLTAAMRYGAAPLDTDKLERARSFKTLVEQQLARVEITCDVPGTTVMMDERVLFVAPGRFEGLVLPGEHTFSATKAGYPRNDRKRNLLPGQKITLPIQLYNEEQLTRYSRHWSAWKPWAVVGAGVAVAAGGGLLHLQARNSFRNFDAGVLSCGGCIPEPDLDNKRTRGDTLQKVAVGTYAAGSAALVTGMVLAYINRAQAYRITPDEVEQGVKATPKQSVSVVPLVSNSEGGILATFRF